MFRHSSRFVLELLLLALALLSCPAWSDTPPSPAALDNSKLLEMVKSGMSVETIVDRIKHSVTDFDVSPSTLELLQDQGVPLKVLSAMTRDAMKTKAKASQSAPEKSMVAAEAEQLRARCPNANRIFYAFVEPKTGDVANDWLSTDQLKAFLSSKARTSGPARSLCTTRYADNADYILLHTSSVGYRVTLRIARAADAELPGPKSRWHSEESRVNFGGDLHGWAAFVRTEYNEVTASHTSAYLAALDSHGVHQPYTRERNTFMVGIFGEPDKRCLSEALDHLGRLPAPR